MKKTVLREYAKLIAKVGANVQKGQEVFITAELDQPEFVAMLVDECYKLKAKKVVVDWSYQPLTKLHVRYRSLKTLSTLDNYEEARWRRYCMVRPESMISSTMTTWRPVMLLSRSLMSRTTPVDCADAP